MKLVLATMLTLVSVMAMADIPRPHIEPGPIKEVDASTLNALVYGAGSAKITELKTGGNTLVVQVQQLAPKVSRYIYTSRQCMYNLAGPMCLENKQMTVTETRIVGPDRSETSYKVSPISKLR